MSDYRIPKDRRHHKPLKNFAEVAECIGKTSASLCRFMASDPNAPKPVLVRNGMGWYDLRQVQAWWRARQ